MKLPVVSRKNAGELLDQELNNILRWGMSVERVAELVWWGMKGVDALLRYVQWFVVKYGVLGVLLERKMSVLLKAIEIR